MQLNNVLLMQHICVGANPISAPMLTYCQLEPKEHISMKLYLKSKYFHSRKCVWTCLPQWRPFVQGETSLTLCLPVCYSVIQFLSQSQHNGDFRSHISFFERHLRLRFTRTYHLLRNPVCKMPSILFKSQYVEYQPMICPGTHHVFLQSSKYLLSFV